MLLHSPESRLVLLGCDCVRTIDVTRGWWAKTHFVLISKTKCSKVRKQHSGFLQPIFVIFEQIKQATHPTNFTPPCQNPQLSHWFSHSRSFMNLQFSPRFVDGGFCTGFVIKHCTTVQYHYDADYLAAHAQVVVANDVIVVYASQDSLSLLHVMRQYQFYARSSGVNFDLGAVTIDPMTSSFDPSPLIPYMKTLGVAYFYEEQSKSVSIPSRTVMNEIHRIIHCFIITSQTF